MIGIATVGAFSHASLVHSTSTLPIGLRSMCSWTRVTLCTLMG